MLETEVEAGRKFKSEIEAREARAISELQEQVAELRRLVDASARELAATSRALDERKKEFDALKDTAAAREHELEKKIADAQKLANDSATDLADLERQIENEWAAHEQTRSTDSRKEQELSSRLADIEAQAKASAEALEITRQELEQEKQRPTVPPEKLAEYENAARAAQEELAVIRKQCDDQKRRIADLERHIENELAAHEQTRSLNAQKEQELSSRLAEIETQARISTEELERTRQELEQEKQRPTVPPEKLAEYENAARAAQEELAAVRKDCDAQKQLVEDLERQIESEWAAHEQTRSLDVQKEQEFARRLAEIEAQAKASAEALERTRQELEQEKQRPSVPPEKLAEYENAVRTTQEALAAVTKECDEKKQLIEDLERRIQSELAAHEETKSLDAKKEQELATRLADIEAQAKASTEALERTRQELEQEKQRPSVPPEKLVEHENAARTAQENLAAARKECDEQKRRIETLEKASAKTDAELSARLADIEKTRDAGEKRIQDLQKKLEAERATKAAEAAKPVPVAKPADTSVKPRATTPPSEWHLKLDDGAVYGPVTESELYNWASECRIGPDHQVSQDKQNWVNAKEVKVLRMEWMVQLVDGSIYGPLNVLAIRQLVNDGAVKREAFCTNQLTKERQPVESLMVSDHAAPREQEQRIPAVSKEKTAKLEEEYGQTGKSEERVSWFKEQSQTAAQKATQEKSVSGLPPRVIKKRIMEMATQSS